jgi:hypothetical protein
MEAQMNLKKDMAVESAKLDLDRDKLEAETSIDLMKVSSDVNKEDSVEAIAMLKENMAASREAMKAETEDKRSQSSERIARENARSKANGKSKKTN